LPPALLEPAVTAMRGGNVPAACVFPIWPKAGRPARFVLIQGRKQGRTPLTLAQGLILHTDAGGFRPEAELILRRGAGLPLTNR